MALRLTTTCFYRKSAQVENPTLQCADFRSRKLALISEPVKPRASARGRASQSSGASFRYILFVSTLITILLVSLTLPLAMAKEFTDLRVSGIACHADGSVSFTVENPAREKLLLSALTLTGTELSSNQTFSLRGNFSKSVISSETQATKKADFLSSNGFFNESGRYKITLTHDTCKYPPCVKEFFLHGCPGFLYDCSLAAEHFQVTQCRATDDQYFVTFQGLNHGQYEKRNPLTQVVVHVTSNARTLATPFVAGKQLKDTSRDVYLLTFPRPAHEIATSIGLGILGCPPENVRTCPVEVSAFTDALLKKQPVRTDTNTRGNDTENQTTSATNSPANDAGSPLLLTLLFAAVLLAVIIVVLALVVVKRT